jgi:pimeloyl-ACP methyl ester carboxylesterase
MIRCLLWAIPLCLALPGKAEIHLAEAIPVGGIQQWITLKGERESDPVLLFLHGGPGNSAIRYAEKFTTELQKHFVVVQWDQRETGKTKLLNSSPVPLTVALFESDAVEVIHYLQKRFGKEKIFLMGHSWGGFLGMTLADRHPELLEGYFAVSPMIHQVESERLSLEWMKGKARDVSNQRELAELEKIVIPFENGEQLYYHRKWLSVHMGQTPAPRPYVLSWAKTWLALFNEASRVNFLAETPEIHCPIYFFVGVNDYQTHFKLIEEYYHSVKADRKDLFWFARSGHLLNLTEPAKLQEIIIGEILSGKKK